MANPWDQFPPVDPDANANRYIILKNDGDTYTGVITKISSKTIPADTFPSQPVDLTDVPVITFEDGRELSAHATVVKNALLEMRPPVGAKLYLRRNGRPKGKSWVDYTVTTLDDGERPAGPTTAQEPRPATSAFNDPPPF